MPALKNWFFSKKKYEDQTLFIAHGSVFGHPKQYKCPDGIPVHTSPIRGINIEENTITLITQNNEYILEKSEVGCEPYKTECLDEFLSAFTDEPVYSSIRSELNKIIEEKTALKFKKAEKLEPGQLYIDLSNTEKYYFKYAITRDKESGDLKNCENHVHVGTIQDSVLICNGNNEMASYFPHRKNSLSFYASIHEMLSSNSSKDGSKVLGYIFNSGLEPLYICFTWGKTIELAPDTEVEVSMENINSLPDSELRSTADMY